MPITYTIEVTCTPEPVEEEPTLTGGIYLPGYYLVGTHPDLPQPKPSPTFHYHCYPCSQETRISVNGEMNARAQPLSVLFGRRNRPLVVLFDQSRPRLAGGCGIFALIGNLLSIIFASISAAIAAVLNFLCCGFL
ncbi:hypothetical protein BX667DRAFT_517434 [Coemansia mojavensis]|nr:hypothetical protein BX667DRAFT_517434 [Coemansia mojavensis]